MSKTIYDPISEALQLEPIDFEFDISLVLSSSLVEVNPEFAREEALERNADIIECDKCGVTGNRPNMMRWHFDNCSRKARECKSCKEDIPMQGWKPFQYDVKNYCNMKCYTESRKGIKPIVMTDEVKRKIGAKTSKPIDIHNTRYTSIISACESLNTTRHEINKMIKDGYAEYV